MVEGCHPLQLPAVKNPDGNPLPLSPSPIPMPIGIGAQSRGRDLAPGLSVYGSGGGRKTRKSGQWSRSSPFGIVRAAEYIWKNINP